MIQLRHQYPALRTGTYQPSIADGDLYGFLRQQGDERLMVLVNSGDCEREVDLHQIMPQLTGDWQLLYGPLTVSPGLDDESVIAIPSRSGGILIHRETA